MQSMRPPSEAATAASSSYARSQRTTDEHDTQSLTTSNPFEEEQDFTSYQIMSRLMNKVKSTFVPSLGSSTPTQAPASPNIPAATSASSGLNSIAERHHTRSPSQKPTVSNPPGNPPAISRVASPPLQSASRAKSPTPSVRAFPIMQANPLPPLVSLTPVTSTVDITLPHSSTRLPSRIMTHGQANGSYRYSPPSSSSPYPFEAHTIPGFPLPDDARTVASVPTNGGLKRTESVSKVIRRIRGEGLSKKYWMEDEHCKECYDCKSVFTAWRRKHHCRICGQIFCSRCASNLIKASRFNAEGTVRVCNLCMKMIEDENVQSDDEDRQSISSLTPSVPAFHSHSALDMPYLASIAERGYARDRRGSEGSGQPTTPPEGEPPSIEDMGFIAGMDDGGYYAGWDGETLAPPFRRGFADADEDKDPGLDVFLTSTTSPSPRHLISSPDIHNVDGREVDIATPPSSAQLGGIPFPTQSPRGYVEKSSVMFPTIGSADGYSLFPGSPPGFGGEDSPRSSGMGRLLTLSTSSLPDMEGPHGWPRSGMRSRVQSKLTEIEPGWRTRRESSAYAAELNAVSMLHLRLILRQELKLAQIPNAPEWETTLVMLGLRLSMTSLGNPRAGDSIDARDWVKIKRIPGGSPRDSECVDGVVISKNVAHKQMHRNIRAPRVMLVTFPLEYQRVEGQFMPLEPLVAQEREYLANLVSRVAALRPHIVLVERSVSRIALELLLERNIAVGRTVKHSAIATIARATQADIISSMDRLALEPRLGRCSKFRVQTFEHELIPGRRKSYMRFEGCHRESGCTLLLRGGDMDTLGKLKVIAKFMVFAVRNLKMETFLWRDLLLSMPQLPPEASLLPVDVDLDRDEEYMTSVGDSPDTSQTRRTVDHNARLSRRIREVAASYRDNFLSVSATLRFSAPYPIRHMLELEERLRNLQRDWERHETKQILVGERADLIQRIGSTAASPSEGTVDLPKTPTPGDVAALKNIDEQLGYFDHVAASILTEATTPSTQAATPFLKAAAADHPVHIKQPSEISLMSALDAARFQFDEYRKMWLWYIHRNADHFHIEKYQRITVLKSVIPAVTTELSKPCSHAQLEVFQFYGRNDLTLGQYIERACNSVNEHCVEKACDKPMRSHSTIYVHNEGRVIVNVEPWTERANWKGPAAAILDNPDRMITWSVCQSCNLSTPVIPLTEESWRYSFAKFLELFFYPADVVPLSGIACSHNVYTHHIRYFWWRHTAVRFQVLPVQLSEVVFPPLRTCIRSETLVELKNADYESILCKQAAFWDSVIRRIHQISSSELQCQAQEKAEKMSKIAAMTPDLLIRADADRHELLALTRKVYDESPMTDTLAFSSLKVALQAKVISWDQKFTEYERLFIPVDRDVIRRHTASQLRRLFANQEILGAFDRTLPHATVEADEKGVAQIELMSPAPSEISESETMSITSLDPFPTTSEGSMSCTTESPETPTPTAGLPDLTTPIIVQEATLSSHSTPGAPVGEHDDTDHESDSTIEAQAKPASSLTELSPTESHGYGRVIERDFVSRLPRRSRISPAIADLVKRLQHSEDVGSIGLAAEDPSDRDRESPLTSPIKARHKHKAKVQSQKARSKKRESGITSDFERSYAANVGPKYLDYGNNSRIVPAPHLPSSRPSISRHPSGPSTIKPPTASMLQGPRPSAAKGKMVLRAHDRSLSSKPSVSSMTAFRSGARRVTGPVSNLSSRVTTLTKGYEKLAKDSEKAIRRINPRYRHARPLATTQAKIQVFDNVRDAMQDESDDSTSSSEADDEDEGEEDGTRPEIIAVPTVNAAEASDIPVIQMQRASPGQESDPVPVPEAVEALVAGPIELDMPAIGVQPDSTTASQASSPTFGSAAAAPSTQTAESEVASSAEKQPSLLQSIAGLGLWLTRPGDWPPLDYPSSSMEHLFADSNIVIREDEPTSIISFALSTKDYKEQIKGAQKAKVPNRFDGYHDEGMNTADRDSSWDMINIADVPDVDDVLKQTAAIHSNQIWESGSTTIFCRVFFAEQFDALRRSCGCESSYIESLARCLKWDASGGKSGSAFLKTRDDRFIAKELSRPELAAMTKFAPKYFEYMSNALSMKKPSLLAKVFGFYKIGYKNPNTGKSMRLNLLVMENLFYERRFSKIYDLKGSMRNRLIQSTGRVNEVLLDENLVQSAHLTPWYIREHSKCVLRVALWNDTSFLCDLNVMDYSLLVGVDSERNELVFGIVDFIRTYTWDKKLESWVKESAFLGGAGRGEPTIVTPRQYKARFLSAMERYFMMVPDRWMKRPDQPNLTDEDQLGDAPDDQ